ANVFLKLENLQRTGSFKIRGAYNKLYKLRGKVKKVIAASAGNHAQGVALAANLLDIKAILVMPEGTPINKFLAVKHYGAEIIIHGKNFDEAYDYARKIEKEKGFLFIHPFDDPDVIAGQGTVGLEIADSIKNLDVVIVPVGGGGLISGVSFALKEIQPEITVIGVQSSNSPSMFLSTRKKSIVETEAARGIADGIAIKRVGEIPFEIAKKYVADVFTVDDDEIEDALLLLTQRKRIVVEGAGAVGLAGLLKRKREFKGKNTVILISGGNIDISFLAKIIERGLIRNGSLLRLELELPDIPGALGILTTLLGKAKGNIIQIFHDRYSKKLPIDKTIVEISLETRNFDHQHEILKLLRESGYKPRVVE
ncbi:MAG: threonine ammonia-lyase, partial [Thermodesulfobacteriota bacterium]